MAENEIVARKHWIAYLKTIVGYGIWFLILLAVLSFLFFAPREATHSLEDNAAAQIVGVIVLVVFALSAFFFLLAWMNIKNFTWTAEEERLVLRSGWLPWQRSEFGIPYDTIFESYVRFGFLDKIFGCRDCVIRRTEGVTSESVASHMTNGELISGKINRKVKELRALRHHPAPMISEAPHVGPAKSTAEELKDLAALKASGVLTAEEFDLMKRKILQS